MTFFIHKTNPYFSLTVPLTLGMPHTLHHFPNILSGNNTTDMSVSGKFINICIKCSHNSQLPHPLNALFSHPCNTYQHCVEHTKEVIHSHGSVFLFFLICTSECRMFFTAALAVFIHVWSCKQSNPLPEHPSILTPRPPQRKTALTGFLGCINWMAPSPCCAREAPEQRPHML